MSNILKNIIGALCVMAALALTASVLLVATTGKVYACGGPCPEEPEVPEEETEEEEPEVPEVPMPPANSGGGTISKPSPCEEVAGSSQTASAVSPAVFKAVASKFASGERTYVALQKGNLVSGLTDTPHYVVEGIVAKEGKICYGYTAEKLFGWAVAS